jgi:hypothetical protein
MEESALWESRSAGKEIPALMELKNSILAIYDFCNGFL